ncbi:hypothetical protein [Aliarcobacter butzleri]|uniref:hypothetical protein n=1 Tax=Aliarcobacter butzleri TaxID=28197 RepID=UPI002447F1EB|nr:hypothetical protein [Aliarcobacter butzleri]MDH1976351.1 hypothetical protein [Aliarcobacter butzleri]
MGKSEILMLIAAFVFSIAMFLVVGNVFTKSNEVATISKVFNDIKAIKDIIDLEKAMDLSGKTKKDIAITIADYVKNDKNYNKSFKEGNSSDKFKIVSKNSNVAFDLLSSPDGEYSISIYILTGLLKDLEVRTISESESLKKICNGGFINDGATFKCTIN